MNFALSAGERSINTKVEPENRPPGDPIIHINSAISKASQPRAAKPTPQKSAIDTTISIFMKPLRHRSPNGTLQVAKVKSEKQRPLANCFRSAAHESAVTFITARKQKGRPGSRPSPAPLERTCTCGVSGVQHAIQSWAESTDVLTVIRTAHETSLTCQACESAACDPMIGDGG